MTPRYKTARLEASDRRERTFFFVSVAMPTICGFTRIDARRPGWLRQKIGAPIGAPPESSSSKYQTDDLRKPPNRCRLFVQPAAVRRTPVRARRAERPGRRYERQDINGVLAVLYGLVFVLMPANTVALYGVAPEPHVDLNLQFFGSALLAFGVVLWFAKDFRDLEAVRGVLIATVVADVVGLLLNLWATFEGLLNAVAWTSTIVSGWLALFSRDGFTKSGVSAPTTA